ncbi:MAG TPA: sugar ABC transporter ATP-binding protein [Nocardioidaceae bacterium]
MAGRNSGTAVEAIGLRKTYGHVLAVEKGDFSADFGEVHALVGENGAGKSTLIKMLCGVTKPDDGRIRIRGEDVTLSDPHHARALGVGTVFQELTLMPWMTVAENLLVNDPPRGPSRLIARRRLPEAAAEVLAGYGVPRIDPRALSAQLSVADRQLIEIVRALQRKPDILFLDEPTASLSENEVHWLFEKVRALREAGTCVIFTSHRWQEVESLADRITVFRNGANVGTRETLSEDDAVQLMTGRAIDRAFPKPPPPPDNDPVLRVRDLAGERLRGVSFDLRPGEILGVGGLTGHGQRELFLSLFGAQKRTGGSIEVGGRRRRIRRPLDAIRAGAGIALVPEDRKAEGLLLAMSVRDNLTLATLPSVSKVGVIRWRAERRKMNEIIRRLAIKSSAPSVDPVGALSGGNQQKVLIGRWLMTDAEVLLLYDVTRGVDVATKQEIYDLVISLARAGKAVLIFSSETEEVARLSHRVLVMREGRVNAELTGAEISAERIVAAAIQSRSGPNGRSSTEGEEVTV